MNKRMEMYDKNFARLPARLREQNLAARERANGFTTFWCGQGGRGWGWCLVDGSKSGDRCKNRKEATLAAIKARAESETEEV